MDEIIRRAKDRHHAREVVLAEALLLMERAQRRERAAASPVAEVGLPCAGGASALCRLEMTAAEEEKGLHLHPGARCLGGRRGERGAGAPAPCLHRPFEVVGLALEVHDAVKAEAKAIQVAKEIDNRRPCKST